MPSFMVINLLLKDTTVTVPCMPGQGSHSLQDMFWCQEIRQGLWVEQMFPALLMFLYACHTTEAHSPCCSSCSPSSAKYLSQVEPCRVWECYYCAMGIQHQALGTKEYSASPQCKVHQAPKPLLQTLPKLHYRVVVPHLVQVGTQTSAQVCKQVCQSWALAFWSVRKDCGFKDGRGVFHWGILRGEKTFPVDLVPSSGYLPHLSKLKSCFDQARQGPIPVPKGYFSPQVWISEILRRKNQNGSLIMSGYFPGRKCRSKSMCQAQSKVCL